MGPARRRAGSVIADPAEVVLVLQATAVQGLVFGGRTGQPGTGGWCGVDPKVDPGFAGGVRVVHYQGDGLGASGDGGQEGAGERSYLSQVYSLVSCYR